MLELGFKFIETLSMSVATPGIKGIQEIICLHCLDYKFLCVFQQASVYIFIILCLREKKIFSLLLVEDYKAEEATKYKQASPKDSGK